MACPPADQNSDAGDKTTVILGDQATLNKDIQRAKDTEACLIIVRGNPQGHRFFITMQEMVIGRDPACDITLADQTVSKKHARIVKNGTQVVIVDQGSANGTFINDRRVTANESSVLAKEDMIKLGSTILKYLPAGELEIIAWGNLGAAAHTDPLTRIYNKGYLLEALEAEFKRAKALHTDFSLLVFDLDHFRDFNTKYTHDGGDYVLKEFASLVRGKFLRPKDVFARYGGEEFVILLANTNAMQAAELAEKIRSAVEAHTFNYDGKRLHVTTSIGVAELRSDVDSATTLFKSADKALYAAKNSGRNRVVVAS